MERKIAVLIASDNNEKTICPVIKEWKDKFPEAKIVVYDCGSTDKSVFLARQMGITVISSGDKKIALAKVAIDDIDADFCFMINGDGSCPIQYADEMLKNIYEKNLYIVSGDKLISEEYHEKYKNLYVRNDILAFFVNLFFVTTVQDIFTGYYLCRFPLYKNLPMSNRKYVRNIKIITYALSEKLNIGSVEIAEDKTEMPYHKISNLDCIQILLAISKAKWKYKPFLSCTILSVVFGIIWLINILNTDIFGSNLPPYVFWIFPIFSAVFLTTGLLLDIALRKKQKKRKKI